ncbi:MAG: TlpA family protein disulfide reductase [Bacteroidia bacterium]|nr:TlpA family protein disulfide reductase [Bacteroidia bacterium]
MFKKFLNYYFIIGFFLFLSPKLQAYHTVITGTAKGLPSSQVYLSCSAWVEDQVSVIGEGGRFAFVIDYPYPAMFEIRYGNGISSLKTELFIFSDMIIEADLISENGNERIFLKIPDSRAYAFKNAKNYTNDLLVNKSVSAIDGISEKIKAIPNIQSDNYTEVFANAEMLNYAQLLMANYGLKVDKPAFSRAEFSTLPKNSEQYIAFPAYKELMVSYNQQMVVEEVLKQQRSIYNFSALMSVTDSMSKYLPEVVRFEMLRALLIKFRYNDLDLAQQELYSGKIKYLINQYPNNASITELELKMVDIFNSPVNRPAPSFALTDINNKTVKLEDFKDGFLLIDVWGSWCKPCRVKNQEIKELYQTIMEYSMDIKLVSIANDQDPDVWKEAIAIDGLSWTQLLADSEFLSNYAIREYPTMILIDKTGKVKKIAPNITLNDLIDVMY